MNKVSLSASRIKTAQSCSWLYWSKYHLKLPDKSNDGANRGTVAHEIFEILGDPDNKKDFDKIILKQDVFASAKVKKVILTLAKKLNVDDEANLKIIKDYTLNGLNYDFFGFVNGEVKESFSEKDFEFDINSDSANYKIKGFIDKLFVYENQAIIRDFKSSKEKFKGKDLEDNLQDLMYVLAVKKMFPDIKKISTEFLFLKFEDGLIKMPELCDEELEGFEKQLSFIQTYLDTFNEKIASKKLAAKSDYPKDNSFSGPLMCGRAKSPDEIKKDGTPMWFCSAKFAFDFYQIIDEETSSIIDSCYIKDLKDYEEKYKDKKVKFNLFKYKGCPAHCKQ